MFGSTLWFALRSLWSVAVRGPWGQVVSDTAVYSSRLVIAMPSSCSINGCFNYWQKTKGTEITYFTFPKEKIYCDLWTSLCGKAVNPKNAAICSVHFQAEDYIDDMKARLLGIPSPRNKRKLKKDAVPSLHLPASKLYLLSYN